MLAELYSNTGKTVEVIAQIVKNTKKFTRKKKVRFLDPVTTRFIILNVVNEIRTVAANPIVK